VSKVSTGTDDRRRSAGIAGIQRASEAGELIARGYRADPLRRVSILERAGDIRSKADVRAMRAADFSLSLSLSFSLQDGKLLIDRSDCRVPEIL